MKIVDIDYDNFLQLGEEKIDEYIIDLHETLNTSDNWINTYWSLEMIIENLQTGHFDITLDEDNYLDIFGVFVEEIDDKTRQVLLGLK